MKAGLGIFVVMLLSASSSAQSLLSFDCKEPVRVYMFFYGGMENDTAVPKDQQIGRTLEEFITGARELVARRQLHEILVEANVDKSRSDAQAKPLTDARAYAMVEYLVAHGLPRAFMKPVGHGSSHPFVPTSAGVREPQNNYVQISLQ